MNLQQLEFFVTLAEMEHMTKAAKQLNTSQPNLSYAMSELEKELGAPLFKKIGRNIRLTKYGSHFYQQVMSPLKQIHMAELQIKDMVHPLSGDIQFGFIYTMGARVAPLLTSQFSQLPDNQDVQFHFKQGNSHQMIEWLRDETLDIALTSMIADVQDIEFTPLIEEELILVVPLNHPLALHDELHLKDTHPYPYVFFSKSSGLRPYLDRLIHDLNLTLQLSVEVEEDHTLLGFVSHNYGIAIMPHIPSINAYPVKKIKILDNRPQRSIYLAIRKNSYVSPATERFYQFCLNQSEL